MTIKHPNSNEWSSRIAAACYIGGCLAASGLIEVNFDDPANNGRMEWAVRVISDCLDLLHVSIDDLATMPPGKLVVEDRHAQP